MRTNHDDATFEDGDAQESPLAAEVVAFDALVRLGMERLEYVIFNAPPQKHWVPTVRVLQEIIESRLASRYTALRMGDTDTERAAMDLKALRRALGAQRLEALGALMDALHDLWRESHEAVDPDMARRLVETHPESVPWLLPRDRPHPDGRETIIRVWCGLNSWITGRPPWPIPVAVDSSAGSQESAPTVEPDCAADGSWLVTADGRRFDFETPKQRTIIRALFVEWKRGGDRAWVLEDRLLEEHFQATSRLRAEQTFARHPARVAGVLIRRAGKGAALALVLSERGHK